jgi:YidC/Oxa1 family membrane protein insertase
MMRFYQENKINPFSSCLPLIAQLPVFLALFYLLREDLRVDICQKTTPCGDAAAWWFIPDLTDKATGGVLITLLVLYVGSQVLSSVLMSVTADRNQRLLFIALPFVFVPFILSFPAGLILYWITTNVWTVVQQTILRKQAGMPVGIRSRPAPTPAPALVGAKSAPAGSNGDGAGPGQRPSAPPPRPPRSRKKKKTGRRR